MSVAEIRQSVDRESFQYLRRTLEGMAGIALSESKSDLLMGRLRKRLLTLQLKSLHEYVDFLKSLPQSHEEWQIFLNCLTTNKTDFFREEEHFQYLVNEALPEWLGGRPRGPWRIWSVPCSTGEEPYTLSMVLSDAKKRHNFDFSVAASDIDTSVLPIARNGVYKKARLSEIPLQYHKEAFNFGTKEIKDWISVKAHIRDKISFKACNLIAPPFPWEHKFDVIFCRNVLIYFAPETITQVIRNLYEAAKPGAYHFVGHSEALQKDTAGWERLRPSVYRKKVK